MSFVSWDKLYLNIFRWQKVRDDKRLKLSGEFSYGKFRGSSMVIEMCWFSDDHYQRTVKISNQIKRSLVIRHLLRVFNSAVFMQ